MTIFFGILIFFAIWLLFAASGWFIKICLVASWFLAVLGFPAPFFILLAVASIVLFVRAVNKSAAQKSGDGVSG